MYFVHTFTLFYLAISSSGVFGTPTIGRAESHNTKRVVSASKHISRDTPIDGLVVRESPTADAVDLAVRDDSDLEKRRTITEKANIVVAGVAVIQAGNAIYAAYLASLVKGQSDNNSCAVISGSVDGVNYQYEAYTSGKNCDTTAEEKTIQSAIEKALEYMQKGGGKTTCFQMSHGGTWTGLLQLATTGTTIISGVCSGLTYVINV